MEVEYYFETFELMHLAMSKEEKKNFNFICSHFFLALWDSVLRLYLFVPPMSFAVDNSLHRVKIVFGLQMSFYRRAVKAGFPFS